MEFKLKKIKYKDFCADFINGPEPIREVCGKSFCCEDNNEARCVILFTKEKIFGCDGVIYKKRKRFVPEKGFKKVDKWIK